MSNIDSLFKFDRRSSMKKDWKLWVKRNELILYFSLAYMFSWAIGIPLAASAQGWIDWKPPFAIHYFITFGPALAA
jgi:hypothetical protein